MYPLIISLIVFAFFHAISVAPVRIPPHHSRFDQGIKTIEYNSSLDKAESNKHHKWILDPGNDHPVLFKIFLNEIVFLGHGHDCPGDAHVIFIDAQNNSATYCETMRNLELKILSRKLIIRILAPSTSESNIFAKISYELIDPSTLPISPLCHQAARDAPKFWPCKARFYAANFSETLCIASTQICDDVAHCPRNEDEDTDMCNIINSQTSWSANNSCFPCGGNTSMCIPFAKICDGSSDCPGGEDEGRCDGEPVSGTSCPEGAFYCIEDAKCLAPRNVCDGLQDCLGLSDESPFACEWSKRHPATPTDVTSIWRDVLPPCSLEYPFLCSSDNQCLPTGAVCNGLADCSDAADESAVACKVAAEYAKEVIRQSAVKASVFPISLNRISYPHQDGAPKIFNKTSEIEVNDTETTLRGFGEVSEPGHNCVEETCVENFEMWKKATVQTLATANNVPDDQPVIVNDTQQSEEVISDSSRQVASFQQEYGPSAGDDQSPNATASEQMVESLLGLEETKNVEKCTDTPTAGDISVDTPTDGSLGGPYNKTSVADETSEVTQSSDQEIPNKLTSSGPTEEAIEGESGAEGGELVPGDSHNFPEHRVDPASKLTSSGVEATLAPPTTFVRSSIAGEREETASPLAQPPNLTDGTVGESVSRPLSEVDVEGGGPHLVPTEPHIEPQEQVTEASGATVPATFPSGSSTDPVLRVHTPPGEAKLSKDEGLHATALSSTDEPPDTGEGATLEKAGLLSAGVRVNSDEGEITFPPLWIARVSSGSFFLCNGALLAGDGTSRWVLIPSSCGRYLHPLAMRVHFGAGIDNYEIISRVNQNVLNHDAKPGFSLLQLNSSENIKHFIPQGITLSTSIDGSQSNCRLLAPRHGYIYSFQLQDVTAEDSKVCSRKYGSGPAQYASCFSQSFCLQNGLGGILTCTNSTLGFYTEGADCYQGQIGWPVLVSLVTADVLEWIWTKTGRLKANCGLVENDGDIFPWFTYFNLTLQSGGLCLGAYVQNDTFPLITSVRCLRQCLQSMYPQDGECVLESVWDENNWIELCTSNDLIQRVKAAASPWRQCLVAHLSSPHEKGVHFERVHVSAFTECAEERFYSRFMVDQGLCITSLGAQLNCSAWGEAGLVQCQRVTDNLWEFVGITQACPRKPTRRWFMRAMEF